LVQLSCFNRQNSLLLYELIVMTVAIKYLKEKLTEFQMA
jgi:hypothetical protein